MTAVQFLSSAEQFSSFPARTVTRVPSPTSPRATTLNAIGRVLFERQCGGRTVQTWVETDLDRKYSSSSSLSRVNELTVVMPGERICQLTSID